MSDVKLTYKLSDHFTLGELIRSDFAIRHSLDNTPDLPTINRLRNLCAITLEQVRAIYNKPIHILSGYRCPELNCAIHGAVRSQHLRGEAADIVIGGVSNRKIVSDVIASNVPFDQIILEAGDEGWVHISYAKRLRREALTAVFVEGQAVYSKFA